MSYCRWSTDDYKCDLYVYKARGGCWVTNVASSRIVLCEPLPEHVDSDKDQQAWLDRRDAIMVILANSGTVAIGLPLDGQSFTDATAGECADRLESLLAMGYRFPGDVIVALREEQAEADLMEGIFQ